MTDDRFSPDLTCDCGSTTFRVQLQPDDSLAVICTGCGGRALHLHLWEDAPDPDDTTPTAKEASP